MRVTILLGTVAACLLATAAVARAPRVIDPVTSRIINFCSAKHDCMVAQRRGIQRFLREMTRPPRPPRARVDWCLKRATNKRQLTDWVKASECVRQRPA